MLIIALLSACADVVVSLVKGYNVSRHLDFGRPVTSLGATPRWSWLCPADSKAVVAELVEIKFTSVT